MPFVFSHQKENTRTRAKRYPEFADALKDDIRSLQESGSWSQFRNNLHDTIFEYSKKEIESAIKEELDELELDTETEMISSKARSLISQNARSEALDIADRTEDSYNSFKYEPDTMEKPFIDERWMGYTKEQLGAILRRLRSMIEDDMNEDHIRRVIKGYQDKLLNYRCNLISRTEAQRTKTLSRRMLHSSLVYGGEFDLLTLRKKWVAEGHDPCEECADLDGQVIGWGEEFVSGVAFPPLHPGCMCEYELVWPTK